MSVIDDISRLVGGRPSTRGNKIGKCPAHEDAKRSFTFKEENGTLLLKCWAGCDFKSILDALISAGVVPELTRNSAAENQKDRLRVDFQHPDVGDFYAEFDGIDYALVTIYKYFDENGTLRGFKGRFKPKEFRRFSYYGPGRVVPTGKNYVGLPYRLPQVLKAVREGTPIHQFEGEKDAENFLSMGLEEATTFGCATDPLPVEWFARFKGSSWVIWADNDSAGLKRAAEVALHLHRNGCRVKVVLTPIGKDFSDWKESGATVGDISKLLAETPLWLPEEEAIAELSEKGVLPASKYDIGSEAFAADFVAMKYRSEMRFAPGFKKWMAFNKKVWEVDEAGLHHERVQHLALVIKREIGQVDVINRKALDKLATKLQTDSGRKAVISTAKTRPALRIDTDRLDGPETLHLLPCESGVIDLRRAVVMPHSPEYLITKMSPFHVDLDNDPQMFLQFVNQLFVDAEVVDWFLNFLGYCLTGETWYQRFVILVGKPGTGKSQLQIVMRAILGAMCADVDASSLVAAKQRSAAVESDLAGCHRARLIFSSELQGQYQLDERVLKCLTGEDVLKVKFMGQDKFPLVGNGKVVLTANDRPPLSDDGGIARRLLEVRLEREPEKAIEYLGKKILANEGAQVLGYLTKRAKRVYEDPSRLNPVPTLQGWTDDFIEEIDFIKQWVNTRTVFFTGAFASSKSVYESVAAFCNEAQIPFDMNISMLTRRLAKFGYKPDRSEGRRGWKNLMLRGGVGETN